MYFNVTFITLSFGFFTHLCNTSLIFLFSFNLLLIQPAMNKHLVIYYIDFSFKIFNTCDGIKLLQEILLCFIKLAIGSRIFSII